MAPASAPARVHVEFFYDDESHRWGFTSSAPALIGGDDRTLEAAARHFARALAHTVQWEQEEALERRQQTPGALAGAGRQGNA